MVELPPLEEVAKKAAEQALDEYIYKDKTLREWIDILALLQWIPCNKKLPDEGRSVLICINDGTKCCIDVSYRTGYDRWERYGRLNENTVAWLPLPEPYKAKSEDNESISCV